MKQEQRISMLDATIREMMGRVDTITYLTKVLNWSQ